MMKTCQMETETALDVKVAKGAFYDSGIAWCILGMGAAFERCIHYTNRRSKRWPFAE